ncbi:integrator complex subunit 3-like [Chenopodium quinoa]|uniref:integrator complex subunit 3-like n=1 Tax=Chenopodium quinoa TaxID=63459 RepID=UPI000B7844DD|nr:integrator complex subunit 3-like [Chenopodium quinoa]
MASKLILVAPHESPDQLEISLREAYNLLLPKLTPPLKLTIPSPEEYLNLNKAIVYGVLCEPNLANIHMKYLHAIVNDGYCLFINLLSQIVDGLYSKMLEFPKVQLIWVASVMIDVSGIGFDCLLVSLLRQIVGGDFSDGNLWLSFEMVNLFSLKWDLILNEEPLVLSCALYTYLRLLADHYRLACSPKLNELKRKEIEFCVRMLREQFHLCLRIGRDLVRLLQDLVHIPEFRAIWKDLLLNPSSFGTTGFSDISCIYGMRTSSRYFLLRITPEMETQLRFLLTHVKLGSQRRHQAWFTRKFLFVPERETLVSDIVRFICCAHHPSNEILQSDVIPRWAVIGWLLKLCSKKYFEANVKLTLFYDWLFFDEKVDNVMNIEPAMLLMVNSIPRYIDMTNSLLEFLLLVVDNYDMDRKNVIYKGMSSAISMLVTKGVIGSLDIFISCNVLSPLVKEMLQKFIFEVESGTCKEPKGPQPPGILSSDMSSQTLPNPPDLAIQEHLSEGLPACHRNDELNAQHSSVLKPTDSAAPFDESQVGNLANLIGKIGEFMKSSSRKGQQLVENILLLYINPANEDKLGGIGSDYLACELKKELELVGYNLFSPAGSLLNSDDEVQSITAVIIRTFIISQHQRIKEMLFWWSRNGCLVGARLLSYALRLAHEAHGAGYGVDYTSEITYKNMPLLKCHIEEYLALTYQNEDCVNGATTPTPEVDRKLISNMIDSAFTSYRTILTHAKDVSSKEVSDSGKLPLMDVVSSSLWKGKSLKFLFCSIFLYLPDLSLSDESVILLLVSQLEDADLLYMQMDLGLKRLTIFGEDVQKVLQLIKRSFYWKHEDQHKIWSLIRSELIVNRFPVEKLLLGCFFSTDFDSKASGIAVGGLLALCSSCAPTPEIVGAVMLLPSDKFPDFAAAILSHWTITNASMLSNSVADFLNKLGNADGNAPLDLGSVLVNQSALLFLLEYFKGQGERGDNMLENLALHLSDVETRPKNCIVPMDTG